MKKSTLIFVWVCLSTTVLSAQNNLKKFLKSRQPVSVSQLNCISANQEISVLRAAQNVRSMPAEVYRVYVDPSIANHKFLFEYDSYGHITSEITYLDYEKNGNYIFESKKTSKYHKMPKLGFAVIEEITEGTSYINKSTAEYNESGMELWSEEQYANGSPGNWNWEMLFRREAVLNNNIRTGLLIWDEAMEPDTHYTFDSKGRITSYYPEELPQYGYEKYVWDNNDRITQYEFYDYEEEMLIKYTNIDWIYNADNIDKYSLDPFLTGFGDLVHDDTSILWDIPLFNADVNLDEEEYSVKTEMNAQRTELTTSYYFGSSLMMKEVLKKTDDNGSMSYYNEEYEGQIISGRSSLTITYNDHGDITYMEMAEDDDTRKMKFDRTYNANGQPEKTIYTENDVETYTETYTGLSGIEKTVAERSVSVYPSLTKGKVNIVTPASVENVWVYSQTGQLLKQFTGTSDIDISELSNGVYFLKIKTDIMIDNLKIVKY